MNQDKLREALEIADTLEDEFAKGRISNFAGRKAATLLRELAASKPEPQAQAGEPEVVAIADGTFNCGAPVGSELITLQSHRDAMAVQAWSKDQAFCLAMLKKDAAWNACVEALENLNALVWGECPSLLNEDSGGNSALAMDIDAAITQAKEVDEMTRNSRGEEWCASDYYTPLKAAEASKPEPQAQAGEPEVAAWVWRHETGRYGDSEVQLHFHGDEKGTQPGWATTPLITLQSHREAMAVLEATNAANKEAALIAQHYLEKAHETIAKKDAAFQALAEQGATAEKQALEVINRLHGEAAEMRAALKACVEAMTLYDVVDEQVKAAITQAEGAMK